VPGGRGAGGKGPKGERSARGGVGGGEGSRGTGNTGTFGGRGRDQRGLGRGQHGVLTSRFRWRPAATQALAAGSPPSAVGTPQGSHLASSRHGGGPTKSPSVRRAQLARAQRRSSGHHPRESGSGLQGEESRVETAPHFPPRASSVAPRTDSCLLPFARHLVPAL